MKKENKKITNEREVKRMKILRKNKGITLVALVVTIVVLIILATVSISAVVGDNGIIAKAKLAKNMYANSVESEQDAMDELFQEYANAMAGEENKIDWNEAMENAKAPSSQDEERNNGVIGIGTDGKVVDMDLWEWCLLEDETFALNDNITVQSAGYLGDFSTSGEIEGKVPQYISLDDGNSYSEVTNLYCLFWNCSELKIAPEIPETAIDLFCSFEKTSIEEAPNIPKSVQKMGWTFSSTNIREMPDIPKGVTNMTGTFAYCKKLEKLKEIPDTVISMNYTFDSCSSLIGGPKIPSSVTTMNYAFTNCSNLITAPEIPSSVSSMQNTFSYCPKLTGIIVIDANLTGKIMSDGNSDSWCILYETATEEGCKIQLTGTCSYLEKIVEGTNNPNIILLSD